VDRFRNQRQNYNPYNQQNHNQSSIYQYSNLEVIGHPTREERLRKLKDSNILDEEERLGEPIIDSLAAANRAYLSGLFSGVAALFILVSAVLYWVIQAKSSSQYWLIMAVFTTACILIALVGTLSAFQARSSILNSTQESLFLSSLGYSSSAIISALLAMTALTSLFMRHFQFNELIHSCGSPTSASNPCTADQSFSDVWQSQKAIISWAAITSVIASILLILSSFLTWTYSKYPVQIARTLVSLGSAVSLFLIATSMLKFYEAGQNLIGHSGANSIFTQQSNDSLFWIGGVLGIILLINQGVNFVRKKLAYFVLFILILALVVALGVTATASLRVIRQQLEPGESISQSAVEGMKTFHEDDLTPACSKYLPSKANTCGKSYQTPYVEGDLQKKSLDPACARKARTYVLSGVCAGLFFTLLAVSTAFAVMVANFKLSDTSAFIESTFRSHTSILEFVGLFAIVVILFVFVVLAVVRSTARMREFVPANSDILQRLQQGKVQELDYKAVPRSAVQSEAQASSLCLPFDTNKMVSVSESTSCTPSSGCGYRLFILAESSGILGVGSSAQTNPFLRTVKYPEARNSLDSFVYLRGTSATINSQLRQLSFCQRRYNTDLSIYFLIERITLSQLSYDGLLPGENPMSPILDDDGARGFPTDFTSGSNLVCEEQSLCKFQIKIKGSNGVQTLIGQLYGKDTSKNYLPMTREAKSTLTINLYHGKTLYGSVVNTSISENGYFTAPVPASSNTPYELTMIVYDTAGRFLSLTKGIMVGTTSGGQVVLGNIPLILPNGKGCLGSVDFNSCANQQLSSGKGSIGITVFDSDTNAPLAGVEVTLVLQQSLSKTEGAKEKTDTNGKVSFGGLDYGYFSVRAQPEGYQLFSQPVTLDDLTASSQLYLKQKVLTAMDVVLKIDNTKDVDTDLNLKILNEKGKECVVSAFSKYCAFALYLYDVGRGASGMETIRIHNLTASYYLVYTSTQFFSTQATCDSLPLLSSHFAAKGIDWGSIPSSNTHLQPSSSNLPVSDSQPFWAAYCFTGFGQSSLRSLNKKSASEPSALSCKELYPDSDRYSLSALQQTLINN
jgi:hypothetical protein